MTTATATTTTPHQNPDEKVDSRFCCNICLDPAVRPVATLCGHLYCWTCLYQWLEPGMNPAERAYLQIAQQPYVSDSNRRICPFCRASCSVSTLVPIYVREAEVDSTTREVDSKSNPTMADNGNPSNRVEDSIDESSDGHHGEETVRQQSLQTSSSLQDDDMHLRDDSEIAMTGLRQRIRFRSRDSDASGESSLIPSRPMAQSPRQETSPSSAPPTPPPYGTWVTPLTPSGGHRGSLVHGMLLSIQQATVRNANGVPQLHHRGGHPADLDGHPGATEYLSRLVLMFSCFVILCLLLI